MMHSSQRRRAKLILPDDIIHREILPRLPVKSLLRFRCVSKSWRSLICSERFTKTQYQNSMRNPSFPQHRVILQSRGLLPKQCSLQSLLSEKHIYPSVLDDPTDTPRELFQVLGCYNGLVCIRKYPGRFYLWNPSTRICKKLPEIAKRRRRVVNWGFGWDESSGEYKVFALLRHWNSNIRGRVYSSKTKSWKSIEYNLTSVPHCWDLAGVFVGGKLYWRNFEDGHDIIFFDLKSEVFGRIELPIDDGHCRCGVIGDFLCLLYPSIREEIQVWVMKESWERLVALSLDHELLQRPLSASSFIHKGSNGEIFVFHGPTLLVYDPRNNEFRYPYLCCMYGFHHHFYVESLLSPEDV